MWAIEQTFPRTKVDASTMEILFLNSRTVIV